MGTTVYGSYDQLVIEVTGLDRLRSLSAERLLVPVDVVDAVGVAPAGRWARLRSNVIAEVGSPRHPAVILELVGGGTYAVHHVAAADIAADLRSCGVGNSHRGTAGGVVAQPDASRPERARRHAGAAARS